MMFPPGFSATNATGIDQVAAAALQDPASVSAQMAQAGIPPPPGAATPGASGALTPGAFGQLASGVQGQPALPGPQYTAGISGAQGVPAPAGISGANSGLANVLGRFAPQQQPVDVRSLGELIRGGR